jgi:hypothetical protein
MAWATGKGVRRAAAAGAAWTAVSVAAAPALAADAGAAARSWQDDPIALPSALLTSAGVASTAAGSLAWAASERRCVSWCRARSAIQPDRELGVMGGTLIGGGIGLLAVAAPALLASLGRDTPASAAGERGVRVGFPLVVSGTTALGAGIGQLAGGGGDRGPTLALSLMSIGTGVVLIPVGATIWAQSGRLPAAPDGDRDAPREPRSNAMKHAGMFLTGLGAAGTVAGAITGGVMAGERGDFAGLGALVVGGSIAGVSAIFVAVGVPLWVAGSRRGAPARATSPSIRIGPTSVEVSVAF